MLITNKLVFYEDNIIHIYFREIIVILQYKKYKTF